jgi:hypothetical protein
MHLLIVTDTDRPRLLRGPGEFRTLRLGRIIPFLTVLMRPRACSVALKIFAGSSSASRRERKIQPAE